MFSKSLEGFIYEQKNKLAQEKMYLSDLLPKMKIEEKNDSEKPFVFYSDIKEKENIPSNDSPDFLQDDDHKMLRYGEFSPNNPMMRVATQPYLGLGEYEQRRQFLSDQRRADYQQHQYNTSAAAIAAEKVKRTTDQDNAFIKNNFRGSRPVSVSNSRDKAVQTDIQNIHTQLVQYEIPSHLIEKEKSPRIRNREVQIDKVPIETQNNIAISGHSNYLGKVGGAQTNSPRAKMLADLQSSCFPTAMGYQPTTINDERLEKARRQEIYMAELRQQIEEKQQLLHKHKEQEKMEQDVASRRLETQLRDIDFDDKHSQGRQHSIDLPVNENKTERNYNRNNKWTENRYKARILDSSLTHRSDPTAEKKKTSKYTNSPPISRRDKPPFSFNIPANSVFANALPVKDKINKNHSKLALNISNNFTTKESQKRISNSKFEESLPIPVLKAQSPVAKELINAVAVQSKTSDAMRKLEDKWQIPAVQKNIIRSTERQSEGGNQGVLTQLGAIRLQLQQEQLRLDETLRKRGTSQTIVADVHHNPH